MLSALNDKFRSSSFVRNSARLLSANILSQSLTLAALPFITRMYSPEAYGNFAFFLIASSIISSISALSLPSSIIRSNSPFHANRIFSICVTIIVLIHTALALVVLPLSFVLSIKFSDVLIILVGSLMTALLLGSQAISNHRTSYKALSRQTVIRAIVYISLALLAPALGASADGMVLFTCHIVSLLLSILYLHYSLQIFEALRLLKLARVLALFRKEKDVVSFMLPASWIDILSERAVALKLQASGMDALLGNFHLSQRTLSMPATVLGSAVARVFTPELAKKAKAGSSEVRKLVFRVWLSLALIGILPLLTVVAFAPQIFAVVFGPGWDTAGNFAQVMAFGYYAKFISTPTSSIYLVARRLSWSFYLTLWTGTSRFIGVLAGFTLSGAYGAIIGYTIADILAIILYNFIGILGISKK